jgi:hypothetical protein
VTELPVAVLEYGSDMVCAVCDAVVASPVLDVVDDLVLEIRELPMHREE